MSNPFEPPQADLHGPDVPASGPRRSPNATLSDALGGAFWLFIGLLMIYAFLSELPTTRRAIDAIIELLLPAVFMVAGGLFLLRRAWRG